MILECSVQTNAGQEELREHGSRLFPVACYHDKLPDDSIPWHWHNELELGLIEYGTAVVEVGSVQYHIHSGEAFFINSNILHSAYSLDGEPCCIHSVVFHHRIVTGNTDTIFWQKYMKPLIENECFPALNLIPDAAWQQNIINSIDSLWQSALNEEYAYELHIRNELSNIIELLGRHQPATERRVSGKAQRDNVRIKEMITFIQNHYDKNLTISDIAAVCAISPSECMRCFRATINTTPIAYLKSYRLQQAAYKLHATADKISNIAQDCGFQEMSYFAKAFREAYGRTPSEYRKTLSAT
ncbi:MAG: AraC family transcriptional regulator [Eubacterium sp.]|nr:AraC family transcriptional regulator [Eubacterium sp.]